MKHICIILIVLVAFTSSCSAQMPAAGSYVTNSNVDKFEGTWKWVLDGKDSDNKTVSNPNICYGQYSIKYADGKTKDFYQVGLSANTSGISIYIMGLKDKKQLAAAFGEKIGKANVTGYCIKFKQVKDINIAILKDAILYGIGESGSE